jgi:EAL domain-containing protein (putative c-di-GMP-specific phosphodiesterase class I)
MTAFNKNTNNKTILPTSRQNFVSMQFELQPIVNLTKFSVCGHEMLYRGILPRKWLDVDRALLDFLARFTLDSPALYVNLSNDALLTLSMENFINAARRNVIYFELSESATDSQTYDLIAQKVNLLTAEGVRIAVDDFGCGFDGLYRVNSLDSIQVIKLDRMFLKLAADRPRAMQSLKALLKQWKDLSILTVAEGIETRDDLSFAMSLNIDMGQGFYIDDMVSGEIDKPLHVHVA